MQAIKTGAKEFFILPLKEEEVKIALKELKKRIKRAGRRNSPEIGESRP